MARRARAEQPDPPAPAALPPWLADVNEAQRRAVEHMGGPLAVLAGPGTGKTRVIIRRIARLLADGAEPERIVAVTFTVKAAQQMRDRLAELLAASPIASAGAMAAQRVNVHTFHGLGLRLVNRFPDLLEMPGELDLIDVPEQRAMLRDLVTRHDILPEARGQGREAIVLEASRAIGLFHNQGIDPDEAPAWAERWLSDIDARAARGEGEGEAAGAIAAARVEQRRFAEFARLYAVYAQHLRERGRATFGDLLTLPCRLLSRSADARAVVQHEWAHVVVDEFQDVNAAQIRMLSLLCPPARSPDLCVVGDDDQAIYGFRGSDDRAFQKFSALYPGHALVELTENHRSSRRVLAVANEVIQRAASRYAPDKAVEAKGPLADDASPVRYIKLESDLNDGRVIGALILARRAAEPALAWSDMAVIARSHGDLDRIAGALRLEGIPVSRARDRTWRDDPAVQDALAWVQLLVNDRDTGALQRLLIRPPCAQPVARVLEWIKAYRAAQSRTDAAIDGAGDPGPALPFAAARAGDDARVARLLTVYNELLPIAAQAPADEAVFRLLKITGVASSELLGTRAQTQRVQNLVRLFRLVRTKQARLAQPRDLRAFWAYYQDLPERDEGDPGDHVEQLADPADAHDAAGGAAENGAQPEAGVQLLTAHTAKGLEFDTVFVPRVSPPHGYPNTKRADEPMTPPGFIDRAGDTRDPTGRRLDEERRLFYVACTRAERHLVLMSRYAAAASSSMSFIDELVRVPRVTGLTHVQTEADALRAAAGAVGGGLGAALAAQSASLAATAAKLERLQEARTIVRLGAADALATIDRPGASPADLDAASTRLAQATAELAAIAHVEATAQPPAWVRARAGAEVDARITELAALCAQADAPEPGGARVVLTRRMTPPLRLSYTKLDQYMRCPRCAYLRFIENVPDAPRDEANLGQIIHGVLHLFFDRWRTAEADGRPKPGLPELLELGRLHWARALKRDQQADPEDRRTLLAQLQGVLESLHDPGAGILELEHEVQLPYELDGQTHTIHMRLDRVDDLGDGRFRIIDYKSGQAWKKHLEPKPDDLQMGLYALALDHLFGDGQPVEGEAEYWVLATAQRGRISLADLKRDKVRREIDKAMRGMLAGEWPKGKNCDDGPCSIYDL